MDTLSKVLLGVVAFATLLQALVVLAIALAGRRLALDLAEVRARLAGELAPVAGDVKRVARNVAEASDTLAVQSRRVDRAVGATTAALQDTADYVGRAVRKGVRPLIEVGALWEGAKQAFRVYRSLRPSASRAYERRGTAPPWEERQSGAVEH